MAKTPLLTTMLLQVNPLTSTPQDYLTDKEGTYKIIKGGKYTERESNYKDRKDIWL